MAARAAWCVAIAAAVATVVVTAEAVAEGSVASAAGAPDAGAHQKAWGPHTGSPFFRSRLSGSDGGASFLSALASAHSLAAGPSLRQLRTPRAPTRDDLDEEAAGDERLSTAAAGTLGDRIDRLLAPTVAASRAGAAYAVARRGVTIASGAAGVANVALGVPLAINSLTDVASVSKQMTAFLIYWLADRGRLSLDDDVRRHVPELPAYAHTVTLRHMVHHVSGLLDCILSVTLSGVTSADALPRPALLAAIARQQRLRFRPGSCFEYSNTNYVLAALVAERVSGTPFRTLLRRVIFEPLGMDDSDVYDSPVRVYPQMAASYSFNVTPPAVPGRQPVEELTVATDQRAFVGASGVVTAPTDLLRWASVFRNNSLGGGAALIKEMETPAVLRYPNGTVRPPTYAFGLGAYAGGLFVTDLPVNGSPVRLVHHPGGIGGYRSMFLRVPAAELVVVLQTTSALFADVFGLATGIAALACPSPATTAAIDPGRADIDAEGGVGGGREAVVGGCHLLIDLGVYAQSLLFPVSPSLYVGALGGIPAALSMDVSPPVNGSDRRSAVLRVAPAASPLDGSARPPLPVTAAATRYPSLQVRAAVLDAAAGSWAAPTLGGAPLTLTPRGGGLGVAQGGVEGRLGPTLLPCCVNAAGRWGGVYANARPVAGPIGGLSFEGMWLTATFGGDTMTMGLAFENGGLGDLEGVPFHRVGTCPV
ncbi:hypothetical protein I4F81_005037 [Pyropia yezoensis]|uniref:Uncharacterized protein n=1 Tax=Pyropia yezoensis TaxID=2788 RepID=A0ACC3BX24_PYRYE|nr:hypothetical protein I4F81_005037 [Neopyropia yezoensis]